MACPRAQELGSFLQTETRTQLVVDRSPQGDLLRINFNVSFPSLPCEFASLDVSDALGTVRVCRACSLLIFFQSRLLTGLFAVFDAFDAPGRARLQAKPNSCSRLCDPPCSIFGKLQCCARWYSRGALVLALWGC